MMNSNSAGKNALQEVSLLNTMLCIPENGYVEIRDSNIHGTGLFSTRMIRANFNYGIIMIDKLNQEMLRRCKDFIALEYNQHLMLPWVSLIGTRYINHSKNANLQLVYTPDHHVHGIACQDISVGEEITLNYRAEYTRVNWPVPDWVD